MKAKDLAALAALGVAGYAAYDKFGKKGEEPKLRGKLGSSKSANDDSEGEYRGNMLGKSQSANEGDAGEAEARMTSMSPTPRNRVDRAAEMEAEYGPKGSGGMRPSDVGQGGSQSATSSGYNKLRAAGANSKTPAAALTDYVAPRTVAKPVEASPAAAEDDYVMPRTAPKPVMPDANRVTQYNSDIMYAPTVKNDPNVAHDDEMNRLARTRATRQGTAVAQSPNDQAQARILRQGPTPVQSATNAQAQARMLRQGTPSAQIAAPVAPAAQTGRYTKDQYGNIIDNMTGKVSSTIFSAGQQGNAARNGMKRGGAVKKMASGGLASSKMSKPSGASRGDGIAQRGRTRGTLR
jgi:hypothetical protein